MSTIRPITTTIPGLAAGALLTLAASPAFAQHELDASLEVGNRINQEAHQQDFVGRNQMIHGNVGGLGFFRDEVGFGAPGDFGDQLGSDDLFRFRAASTPMDIGEPAPPVQRSFSAPTLRRQDQDRGALRARGGDARITADTLRPFGDNGQFDFTPGVTVRSPELGDTRREPLGQDSFIDGRLGQRFDVGEDEAYLESLQQRQPRAAIEAQRLGDRGVERVDFTRGTGLLLGQQLGQQPRDRRLLADSDLTFDEQLEKIRAEMFSPIGDRQAEPGEDVYMDLLTRLDDRDRILRGEREQPRWPEDHIVGLRPDDEPDTDAEPPLFRVPDLTAEERAEAEQARIHATRRALGLPVDDPEEPEADPQAPAAAPGLIDTLDYEMPAIRSLVGRGEDGFNREMARGERLMAEGKYFQAERLYESLVDRIEDNPLPRVGLIHAQLGAGLVRSSANNLRRLMADHPELIATRYDAALLPEQDRLEWLQGQLMRMIRENESPEAALVMAYLGHQAGEQQVVSYGLDRAGEFKPEDGLLPLLRRIWIGDEDAEGEPAPEQD